MKKFAMLLPVLVVAAVLASGCATTPYDGSPPKVGQSRVDAVTASATAWLAGDQGRDAFPAGLLGNPVPVFDENRTFEHWILPVKNDKGLYIGFMITKNDNFQIPELGVTMYPDPRHDLFSTSKEDAYSQMLSEHVFTSDQMKEPYVSVVEGKGYAWTSEVVINGKKVNVLYILISILNPSAADDRSGGRAGFNV